MAQSFFYDGVPAGFYDIDDLYHYKHVWYVVLLRNMTRSVWSVMKTSGTRAVQTSAAHKFVFSLRVLFTFQERLWCVDYTNQLWRCKYPQLVHFHENLKKRPKSHTVHHVGL